jgi:hypothetical protein
VNETEETELWKGWEINRKRGEEDNGAIDL